MKPAFFGKGLAKLTLLWSLPWRPWAFLFVLFVFMLFWFGVLPSLPQRRLLPVWKLFSVS